MARKQFSIQGVASRAADALPQTLEIDGATLELFPGGRTKHGEAKFRALWSNGRLSGEGRVQLEPLSKATSRLTVSLDVPTRTGRVLARRVLSRMSEQFGLALQYEIETKADEQADPFSARRTTAELVRSRSA